MGEGQVGSMKNTSTGLGILRPKSLYVFGWVAFVGMLALAVFAIFYVPPRAALVDRVGFTVFTCLLAWGTWLVAVNSRVIIGDGRLIVINCFIEYDIPYSSIESLSPVGEVRIMLTNGWVVRPVIGSFSLISMLRGGTVQKRIAEKIESSRSTTSKVAGSVNVCRKVRVYPGRFLLLTAAFVGLTILAYYVRR
jgi:hypothetical protein